MRGRRPHGDTLPRAHLDRDRRPDRDRHSSGADANRHPTGAADGRALRHPDAPAGANREPHANAAATNAGRHTHRKHANFHRNPALSHPATGPNRDPYRPASDHRRRWI